MEGAQRSIAAAGGVAGRIHVDDREWPLLIVRGPSGARSDADLEDALDALRPIALRGEPHVVLVEVEGGWAPSTAEIRVILERVRALVAAAPAHDRPRCLAAALVTRSPRVRAIADSIRWMHLTPARFAHFEDATKARGWLLDLVEAQQLGRGRDASATHPVARRRSSLPPPI